MWTSDSEKFSEVRRIVEEWFSKLRFERKYENTHLVSKAVNHSSDECQEYVRKLISININEIIEKAIESKGLMEMLSVCNVINGCFDNFVHATRAVYYSVTEILTFIDVAVGECQLMLCKSLAKSTTVSVLELLHGISRITILVLKLYRMPDKVNPAVANTYNTKNLGNIEKEILSLLTSKINMFLTNEDILLDTRNNFAICDILIKEIFCVNKEELIEYHKQFLDEIPGTLENQPRKLLLVKFILSSAILSTWSISIIDKNSIFTYLKFFINLSENYSSETSIILNTSRTLLILIKHESFKKFIAENDDKTIQSSTAALFPCIFMLLEHPVACVRHSAKDLLVNLTTNSLLQTHLIDFTFKIPREKRSYFICIAALANAVGPRTLIEKNSELPGQLTLGIQDPTIVSHVSYALENMILKDSLAESDFSEWCEIWIVPLLILLTKVLRIVSAEIDKVLEKAFKKYPNSLLYITEKWRHPKTGEELRCVITALKISHKQGFKFKTLASASFAEKNCNTIEKNKKLRIDPGEQWNKLISRDLLKHCLYQEDDDIRLSGFSLLIEARKTSEVYSKDDFDLILYFLKYNLNNYQPATRQKLLSLMRKMLLRFSESQYALRKEEKLHVQQVLKLYDKFLRNLTEFCFSNIFIGCNFNRLNTVLNILLLCFEIVDDMSFNSEKTDYYWNKFLIALDSSYEENKILVLTLSKKLDYSSLGAAQPEIAKSLFEKAFKLIGHLEPPDVLTGSYLLQILINLPSSKAVLSIYFTENVQDFKNVVHFNFIKFLLEKLKTHVALAKLDLTTAAACGPMYGILFAIRLIFKDVNFVFDDNSFREEEWKKVLNDLVNVCFDLIPIVSCVVNSSSPEGHLPMDFQSDFQNLIIDEGFKNENEKSETNLMEVIFENCCDELKEIEFKLTSSDIDIYETLRSLKCLMKKNELLISKAGSSHRINFTDLTNLQEKIAKLINQLDVKNLYTSCPVTAQGLLLCAWRSIKEACLYLGDFLSKLPVEVAINLGLLSKSTLVRIGEELKTLLCEIKHRGSFEHVYLAFSQFVNSLWKCSDPDLNNLPRQWLEQIADHLDLPLEEQKLKLCSTRRSAGLPFLVQAVVCSEIVSVKSSSSLNFIMMSLLERAEKQNFRNPDSKIHALNILRALFKHAQLGEFISLYISKAVIVAIRGARGPTWSERNSSNLLFSALITRIFGVSRSRDEISKKNRMTSRTFFQRYSELFEFLLSEMKLALSEESDNFLCPKPSLYLVLLILGRLYPPSREDLDAIDLSEFLPFINLSRQNPIMKVRELAARALVPLISLDKLIGELDNRFSLLRPNNGLAQNEMHGILLQVKALLVESSEDLNKIFEKSFKNNFVEWIENSKWMLGVNLPVCEKVSFIIISSYINVLHILFKHVSAIRQHISKVILNCSAFENLCTPNGFDQNVNFGIHLCFEKFYFLKTDILAYYFFHGNDFCAADNFLKLFQFMLDCSAVEVRSIPLRILCDLLKRQNDIASDEDCFAGIGSPINELFIFQTQENAEKLRRLILSHQDILNCLPKYLNYSKCNVQSKLIQRLSFKAVSALALVGSLPRPYPDYVSGIHFIETLFLSGDKELSSSALIIYSAYVLRETTEKINCNKLSVLTKALEKFSSPDADLKERLAVAKILVYCFDCLIEKNLMDGMNIWMIPIKLLVDEDLLVRQMVSSFVYKMQTYLLNKGDLFRLPFKIDVLDWPTCSLVPLKAQETLLNVYINILPKENFLRFIIQMLIVALSSFCDENDENIYSHEEFGVFEKGNPNPFCEEIALSILICDKLSALKNVTCLESAMTTPLNEETSTFLVTTFHLDKSPLCLKNMIESLMQKTDSNVKSNNEFSFANTQIFNLREALY